MQINTTPSTPRLDALMAVLSRSARARLFRAAANGVRKLVTAHLRLTARTHHKTAQRLGAEPTGHLREAEKSVAVGSRGFDAHVVIRSPGFRRVFGAFTVRPVIAKALTIPVHAISYGKRVAQLRAEGRVIFRPKGADYLAYSPGPGQVVPLYILAKSVLIPQDRSLLPTDAAMGGAAKEGILGVIRRALEKKGD
ncbi:MAG: hypothetical protein FWH21_00130 [Kiritimatiellaeota bacterium]|nr:hypothetical protein [Kiritimatiellota bacterium]